MTTDRRFDFEDDEEIRRRRRASAKRRAEKKRKRKRKFYIRVAIRLAIYLLILGAIITGIVFSIKKLVSVLKKEDVPDEIATAQQELVEPNIDTSILEQQEEEPEPEAEEIKTSYYATPDEYTKGLADGVASTFGIFIDLETGKILEEADSNTRMFPASMTKVLTCLVAAEHVDNLDDTFTMTSDINYYAYKNDCSTVGFSDDEVVTVRDLFYGTILPSGGEAAVGLATYVAGSQEAFVDMMNQKVAELGLSDTTHFTNCVGLYSDDHYTTAYDMAMIMEAAMDNELCREVMHAHTYTTGSTAQHPAGIEISNWFLRKIEDHVTGGEIYCAKTGFVNESGNCAVSYGVDESGRGYICVTGNSTSSWKCIKDHVAIYDTVFNPAG